MDTMTNLQKSRIAAGILSVEDLPKVKEAQKKLRDAEANFVKVVAQAHVDASKTILKMVPGVTASAPVEGKRGPGRPKGSKNKPKVAQAPQASTSAPQAAAA